MITIIDYYYYYFVTTSINQADDRKKRTLAAYDAIARSGVAGPKIVVREELEHMDSKYTPLPEKKTNQSDRE